MDTLLNKSLAILVLISLSSVAPSARAEVPAHEEAQCRSCHQLDEISVETIAVRRSQACSSCHGLDVTHVAGIGSSLFHADSQAACTRCHAFHDADALKLPGVDANRAISLASLAGARKETADLVQCKPCHQTGGPDPLLLHPGHQAASAWYHANVGEVASQSISESCLRCHDRDQDLPSELGSAWNPPRPARSANHPFGITPRANMRGGYGVREQIDPRLLLFQGRIECTTCHDLYVTTNDMLVEFETRAGLCTGCHVRTTSPDHGPSSIAMGR